MGVRGIVDAMNTHHQPVLLSEVLRYLAPRAGQVIVDGTFGQGGHASAIAEMIGDRGRLIGVEQDERTLKLVKTKMAAKNIMLKHGNFVDLPAILRDSGVRLVDGILLDLGISSWQLSGMSHGLSWQSEAPLDMRLGDAPESAKTLIKRLSEKELADMLYRLANERRSRIIARAIKERQNSLESTADLADIIEKTVGRHGRIHPATRTFMALRILVNRELENLERFMETTPSCLKPGGRLVIISFHSGEDRIVKHAFKDKETWLILTKKPVVPTRQEIVANRRSRSAKLRAAARISINPKLEVKNKS